MVKRERKGKRGEGSQKAEGRRGVKGREEKKE